MAKAANHLFAESEQELFKTLKSEFLNYDPAEFTKNKLRLDKQPFNVVFLILRCNKNAIIFI